MSRFPFTLVSKIILLAVGSVVGVLGLGPIVTVAHATSGLPHDYVAYVTDSSSGSFKFLNGSNVWDNAVNVDGNSTTDCNPHHSTYCHYVTPSGKYYTFDPLDVAYIDRSSGSFPFFPHDIVFLYQVCDIGSHPGLISALNQFIHDGGYLIIYDGGWCRPGSGGLSDYTKFPVLFSTISPGPSTGPGSVTYVETENPPATLTRDIHVGDGSITNAVGDSDTLVTLDPDWCTAIEGRSVNGIQGAQVAYAYVVPNYGLVVYNGQDNSNTTGPSLYAKRIFDNILDEHDSPSLLPCNRVSTGITLEPSVASTPTGSSHTHRVFATLVNGSSSVAAIGVTFNVSSGPNAGTIGSGITDANGNATFTYHDSGGAGTDVIRASFQDSSKLVHESNPVSMEWMAGANPQVTVITRFEGLGGATLANLTLFLNGNAVTNGTTTAVIAGQGQTISESFNPSHLSGMYQTSYSGDCNLLGYIAPDQVVANASLECTITNTFNFFVLPESPIGAVALMVAGLASLAAYIVHIQKRSRVS